MECVVLPAADADIDGIARFIAIDSLDAAERFLEAALDATDDISRFPTWNPFVDRDKYPGLRRKPIRGFENYLIFYVVTDEDHAHVMRVIHGARELSEHLDALFGS